MKCMSPREWKRLLKNVKRDDTLLVPRDKTTPHYKEEKEKNVTFMVGSENYILPDIYEVLVLKVYSWGFVTNIIYAPQHFPLRWNENYNFAGTKIKPKK